MLLEAPVVIAKPCFARANLTVCLELDHFAPHPHCEVASVLVEVSNKIVIL